MPESADLRQREEAHWRKTTRLMLTHLGIWFFFGYVIHMFVTSLNNIVILGFPLGYYMAAQGSLIAFVVMLFWFARKQNAIDEEYGVAPFVRVGAAHLVDRAAEERADRLVAEEAVDVADLGHQMLGEIALRAREVERADFGLATSLGGAFGLAPGDISTVYFTGGSSGMAALREAFAPAFAQSRMAVGDLFGSVVSGLGIDATRRFA